MISRRIRFIVLLVSVALLGVFLLQGYWLYNAYRLSSEEFQKAVVDVAGRIERQHVRDELAQVTMQLGGTKMDRNESVDSIMTGLAGFLARSKPPVTSHDSNYTQYRFEIRTIDSVAVNGTRGNIAQNTINFNNPHEYTRADFERFADELKTEADSVLRAARIRSNFALQLTGISGHGPKFVTDSVLFARVNPANLVNVRVGLQQPYEMTLAVEHDAVYVLRNLFWALLASVAIIGAIIWAFVLMLRTILRQKRLSDIKTDFINNMTHEFKTPIATVSLAVEALQRFNVMDNPARASEYLDISSHELNRLSVMVEKVLKMAVFERGDIQLTLQQTDLGKLVGDVVDNMRPMIAKYQGVVSIKGNGHLMACVDRTHITSVLYNLIENGLKYTLAGAPYVEIDYGTTPNEGVVLSVRDQGIGIASAYQKRIFENFFRVPTGNLHHVKGFGLGLGYVAAIINRHGGHIGVASELGKGSIFTIRLPSANQQTSTNIPRR